MTNLTSFGNKLNTVGEFIEERFHQKKDDLQYKYLTRPVYKFFVRKTGPVVATFFSFLSADLIIHQLEPRALGYLAVKGIVAMAPTIVQQNPDSDPFRKFFI